MKPQTCEKEGMNIQNTNQQLYLLRKLIRCYKIIQNKNTERR